MARCYLSRSVAGQVSAHDTVWVSDASHCLQVFRTLIEARGRENDRRGQEPTAACLYTPTQVCL